MRDKGELGPDDQPPAASFLHTHPAQLAAAAVPIASRDPVYRLAGD